MTTKGATNAGLEASAVGRDVGQVLVEALIRAGVDHIFFTSGTELAFVQEALAKAQVEGKPAPRLILMTHEYPCLNAALGYAAVTGRPAVTTAHVDVGTQHHGCALHTAWHSGLPVLMMAGAPATSAAGRTAGSRDAPHFWVQQTFDQNGIVRAYTKWDHRLEYHDNPGLIVSRALQVACAEPKGPVYLSLPREIVYLPAEDQPFPSLAELSVPTPAAPDPDGIRVIAQKLVEAENPLLVVGSGRDPRTVAALVELAELIALPVVQCAWHSYMSFPYEHPLFQGKRTVADGDVVVALQCDVPWVPGIDQPREDAFVATIDSDPVKHKIPTYEFTADLRVTSDAFAAIDALTREVRSLLSGQDRARFKTRHALWAERSAERRKQLESRAVAKSKDTPIAPEWVAYQLAMLMDDDTVVIDDTTHDRIFPYLSIKRPGRYFHNPGSAGGWSPGAALGAKLAAPERDVVAVSGDGFYLYGSPAAALWSARRSGAPFLMVVFQNRSYTTGTVAVARHYPEGFAAASGFEGGYLEPAVDFAKEAEAVGSYGETVVDPAEVGPALRRGLAQVRAGIPAVIAVRTPRLIAND